MAGSDAASWLNPWTLASAAGTSVAATTAKAKKRAVSLDDGVISLIGIGASVADCCAEQRGIAAIYSDFG
ncbi:hypothetical protein E2562_030191 [Oryza meyeriana var. granulata]|uniref:Uncharacterized protein n=1 Tax=Oryza meyeriana var. granulata TaxID=110450 RepID=A0A6G1D840_9ORYZ|nr:hypothetical protein E2562_030191 [Oryza meyeriana var. granulata]